MLFKIKDNGIDVLFKFAKAYALLLGLTFVELSIGLALLRVHYAILWAALIALVDILPVLGTGTVLIPWAVVNLILGNYPLGVGLLVLYGIITVVRQSLEPRVVGKQIGLYPLVTLVCMFLGSYLFGFVGLFALPIAVTVLVQLSRTEGFALFK
jgi:sporulation integral membrane protein YtvI